MMNVCKKIFVSGYVQGVFFRESTRQLAVELKLNGGVRNLLDGRVEVQVTGEKANIETLINWLKIGPNHAKVSNIEVVRLSVSAIQSDSESDRPKGFEIWPSQ